MMTFDRSLAIRHVEQLVQGADGLGSYGKGTLCPDCIVKRLGRNALRLTTADFTIDVNLIDLECEECHSAGVRLVQLDLKLPATGTQPAS